MTAASTSGFGWLTAKVSQLRLNKVSRCRLMCSRRVSTPLAAKRYESVRAVLDPWRPSGLARAPQRPPGLPPPPAKVLRHCILGGGPHPPLLKRVPPIFDEVLWGQVQDWAGPKCRYGLTSSPAVDATSITSASIYPHLVPLSPSTSSHPLFLLLLFMLGCDIPRAVP